MFKKFIKKMAFLFNKQFVIEVWVAGAGKLNTYKPVSDKQVYEKLIGILEKENTKKDKTYEFKELGFFEKLFWGRSHPKKPMFPYQGVFDPGI